MTLSPLPRRAIILAGGFGTRLRSVINDLPKPMAPVAQTPFLTYLLDNCLLQGVEHFVLAVGYRHESIIAHFGERYHSATLRYAVEQTPLGTGGAIKQALTHCPPNEPVYVLNGDTLFTGNLHDLFACYQQHQAVVAIGLAHLHNFDRYGVVLCDEQERVNAFREKSPCVEGFINAGVYVLSPETLREEPEVFSFEKDFLEKKLHMLPIYARAMQGYFIDIGIPEDYQKAQLLEWLSKN